TRSRVAWPRRSGLLKAKETAVLETPAASATSVMVTRTGTPNQVPGIVRSPFPTLPARANRFSKSVYAIVFAFRIPVKADLWAAGPCRRGARVRSPGRPSARARPRVACAGPHGRRGRAGSRTVPPPPSPAAPRGSPALGRLGQRSQAIGIHLRLSPGGEQSVLLLLNVGELGVAEAFDRPRLHERIDERGIRGQELGLVPHLEPSPSAGAGDAKAAEFADQDGLTLVRETRVEGRVAVGGSIERAVEGPVAR